MTELEKKEWQAKIDDVFLRYVINSILKQSNGFITNKNISKGEKLALATTFNENGLIVGVTIYTCEKITTKNFATGFKEYYRVGFGIDEDIVKIYHNNIEEIGVLQETRKGLTYYIAWLIGCDVSFLKNVKNEMTLRGMRDQKTRKFEDYETTQVEDELTVHEK